MYRLLQCTDSKQQACCDGLLTVRRITIAGFFGDPAMVKGAPSAGVTAGSEYEKMFIANTPLGRRGQPDDVAKAAVFLASDDAAWVTGEQISVSGGMYGF
jgi:3-oxoacyl-[acyl-carrier protein] reductase